MSGLAAFFNGGGFLTDHGVFAGNAVFEREELFLADGIRFLTGRTFYRMHAFFSKFFATDALFRHAFFTDSDETIFQTGKDFCNDKYS